MGQIYADRYESFRSDNDFKPVPGIKIPKSFSDKHIPYKLGSTRLDILSNEYYQSPYFGWLIMLANPEYGGLEFMIPDNSIIRIPFPLNNGLNLYFDGVDTYIKLYR